MILLCCSFASASFTSRNHSPLSVDRLNSKIYTICRASLNAPLSGRLPQKQFVEKEVGSRLYCLSSLFFLLMFSPLFLVPQSLLQNFLALAFWLLCSMHAVVQMPPDEVAGSRDCVCHSFAACTVNITVCFSCQIVNTLT